MQPGVTLVLAVVWLVVYADVVRPTILHPSRLTLDQYSPLAPQQHGVYRRIEDQLNRKDPRHDGDQPFEHSIGSRGSIPTSGLESSRTLRDHDRNAQNAKIPTRELLPPSESEDPFAADDTFQDQGPGSVEIYNLDLLRVKPLLSQTQSASFPPRSKSKPPKKSHRTNWKSKTVEQKPASPRILYKQSNSFDDFSTEIPPHGDPFGVGGVPELQVGCEGLEATDHEKRKRSIVSTSSDKKPRETDPWASVTPISLDIDYDPFDEEGYEEMDELVKLKKFETTTKNARPNRGDMEATLYADSFDDKGGAEKLPVRGDLGKSNAGNDSSVQHPLLADRNQGADEKSSRSVLRIDEGKRDEMGSADGPAPRTNQRRKILWFRGSEDADLPADEKRVKRGIWGFGEDEGVVSSDELQTENQRRRLDYERRRKEDEERRQEESSRRREEEHRRRSSTGNRTNADIERIRQEYERSLEQRQRQEEERQRRFQQELQRQPSNRRQMEDEHRRRLQEVESRRNRQLEEERRMQGLEASRRRQESRPPPTSNETERREHEQRAEIARRREENRLREEETRRRLREEEEGRRNRWQEEARRRQQQEHDRLGFEERQREWMMKRKQFEEDDRKMRQRNEPSNLLHPLRTVPGESGSYSGEAERRMREQQEAERRRKLDEYVQRNRPINVNNSMNRQRSGEAKRRYEQERKRHEEERKLQEYIRRNQPVRVAKINESRDDNLQQFRRRMDETRQYNRSRYPGSGSGRRNHGPSASTEIDPRNYVDESRRRETARRIEEERIRERQRQQEELRRESLRREEEVRRMQSRRYEVERRRLQEQRETEARRNETGRGKPFQNTRPSYEDRRRFEDHRRRQDTSLIPANLLQNESRRAMELERQRQENERRRAEAERRRHEGSRAQDARDNDPQARAMKEQRRRQEEARLNALPVSARIIVRPASRASSPNFLSRSGFDTDIDFQGVNPYRPGVAVPNFPASPTPRSPVKSPPPCVWAVVHCCASDTSRLITCFESLGCPGVNWDPNPCRGSITQAARDQVLMFYAENEEEDI